MSKKKTITLDAIRGAIASSIDHDSLARYLGKAGVTTDVCETRVMDDGTVYIGGGENDTAFEAFLAVTELTLGWQTWAVQSARHESFAVTAAHLERQRAFSAETFGPGARLKGVLDHIRKELVEVEAEPGDVSEWADVVILAFDGALRQGHEPQVILDAIAAKQTRNEGRLWPDWRTQPLDRAIEHVRSDAEGSAS